MNIVYCEPRSAFFAIDRNRLPIALPPAKARLRHENRQSYEAIIGAAERLQHVVCLYRNAASTQGGSVDRCMEGNGDSAIVYFLDERTRWYLQYEFQEKQPGRLFLTGTIFREFVGDSSNLFSATTFRFHEDGQIFIERRHLVNDTIEEREASYSVAENWEDYPSFGDYASLCREER